MPEVGERMRPERGSFGARNRLFGQDETDRGAIGELEDVLGQAARRRISPVRVLDRHDDRL